MTWEGATWAASSRRLPAIASRSISTQAGRSPGQGRWFTGAPPRGSPDPARPTGAPPRGSPDPSGASPGDAPGAAVEQLAEGGRQVVGDVAGGDRDGAQVGGGEAAGAAVDPGAEAG